MHNVEFKCELRDLPLAKSILKAKGATFIAELKQTDTYYRIPSGRLKKRECEGEPVEYVHYDRPNRILPKLSHFTIFTETQAFERFGLAPLPVWVVVRKTRELWLSGNTRIHLDKVENLGTYLEFEALVCRDFNVARCHEAIAELRTLLGPVLGGAIDCSYSDMLAREAESQTD